MTRPPPLLARYAEGLFWMARYMERVENIARLIDVTQQFEMPSRAGESWYALIRINADEESYEKSGYDRDAVAVKQFYLMDYGNPTSIPASIDAARLNARTLRPVISTEMWTQLNILHRELTHLTHEMTQGDQLSRLCARIKQGVQEHTGITDGTFFRDEGWFFYQLGRSIERADQTTRLLDIQYHLLVPDGTEERRLTELTQWGGVLRAAAGHHAFRRVAPPGFSPTDVVRFLLADASFPRSVLLCVSQMEWQISTLRSRYGLRGTVPALERIEELRAGLLARSVEQLVAAGLHSFLDRLQSDLIMLASEIGTAFFRDWRPLADTQIQSQSQAGLRPDPPGSGTLDPISEGGTP